MKYRWLMLSIVASLLVAASACDSGGGFRPASVLDPAGAEDPFLGDAGDDPVGTVDMEKDGDDDDDDDCRDPDAPDEWDDEMVPDGDDDDDDDC